MTNSRIPFNYACKHVYIVSVQPYKLSQSLTVKSHRTETSNLILPVLITFLFGCLKNF